MHLSFLSVVHRNIIVQSFESDVTYDYENLYESSESESQDA